MIVGRRPFGLPAMPVFMKDSTQTNAVHGAPSLLFPYTRRLWENAGWITLGDFLALTFALVAGGLLRHILRDDAMLPGWTWLILPIWAIGAWVTNITPGWGMGPVEHLRKVVVLLMASFGLASAALFLTQTGAEASRFTLTTAFLMSLLLVPFLRVRVKAELLHAGRWGVPTVIYGSDATTAHVLESLTSEAGMGYVPVGIFDDESSPGSLINGIPVLGGLQENTPDAPYAIIATAQTSREALIQLLEGPLMVYRRVILIPDLLDAPSLWVTPRDFVGLVGLEVAVKLLNPVARWSKRVADVVMVLCAAPFWLPLCGGLACWIWWQDRHSPFFVQERVGYLGERFKTYKFRTMHPNAEEVLQRELAAHPELEAEWAVEYKLKNDPRVTKAGIFLRKTSLDELPQLLNVLRGEMSLVGPRPLPDYHYQRLRGQIRTLRDRVRPGLTGLWQVSGRSEAGTQGMERWDAYYVRNWSVWLDIVILVRTVRVVLSAKGAY